MQKCEDLIMLCYTHCCSTHFQANALNNEMDSCPVTSQNRYDPGCATRGNQNPVCTHSTKMHQSIYPSTFFCLNCEWWEREVGHCNKHVSRQSKTYSCKAKHYSWLVPRPLWTVTNNRMLSKEEAEYVMLTEANMNGKKNEQNDDDSVTTGEETVCTVDEEDVEDHGSFSQEDNNMPDTKLSKRVPNDSTEVNQVVCNYATAFLPGSSDKDDSDDDYDDNTSSETNMFPAPEAKCMRLASDQDELEKLQSKCNKLTVKTENF